ncbi:MAG: type 1 glutamine amidotransferase [Rhodospirillales bacterium]|nr:type 1 glutamine amidotransferase [Rhodospirillales bacterium]
MARILTLEFWPTCHLGEIARTFDARGAFADYRRIEEGDQIPDSTDGWDGLVMLGGPQYAEDDAGYPYLAAAVTLARAFHDLGKPVLGVCLGSQILARALDARVRKQGWTELGFIELSPTEAAATDPVLAGIAPTRLVQFHEDTFDIPPGAVHLMTGTDCANQAYRMGASYGFQCHIECSTELWKEWLTNIDQYLYDTSPEYHANWPRDFAENEAGSLEFCATISGRWLDLVEARRLRLTNRTTDAFGISLAG